MKAMIKETGEVLIVEAIAGRCVYLKSPEKLGSSIVRHKDQVEFLSDNLQNLIDWEQRRYELAKEAMGAFIASPSYQLFPNNNYYEAITTPSEHVAKDAVDYADALISKLREPKPTDEFSSIVEQAPNLHKALEEIASQPIPDPMTWKVLSLKIRDIALSAIGRCE